MKRARVILWVVVIAVAVYIVWQVGFHSTSSYPAAQSPEQVAGPNQPSDSNRPADVNALAKRDANTPSDANKPPEPNRPTPSIRSSRANRPMRPDGSQPGPMPGQGPDEARSGQAKPADPNAAGAQLEAVNLKDVEMKNVIDKIAAWTGKTVIPSDDAMKQKITIYASEKLPRNKALAAIDQKLAAAK